MRQSAGRQIGWAILGIGLLLAAGCGDSRPAYEPPPRPAPAPQAAAALPPAPAASPAPENEPDPLLGGTGKAPVDTLLPVSPNSTDPLAGAPRMPTEHSHWLRGGIVNASVVVLLNGLRLGEWQAPIDKDITMKLHKGINSITFLYTPHDGSASAHMDVLESEHDPPIPPLATFASGLTGGTEPSKPTARTFSFFAR